MSDFIVTDASEIQETIIKSLEKETSESLYPGDERRIFGDALVAVFVSLFARRS